MTYATLKTLGVLITFLIAAGLFGRRAYQLLWVNLKRGQPSPPFKQWPERLKSVAVYVGAQLRLFRFLVPGTAHFFIFWGFIILALGIAQALIEGLAAFADPEFKTPILSYFGPLALAQDLFLVCVLGAITYALVLRVIVNPERYKGSHKSQGIMVLLFILAIMLGLVVMNGANINLGRDPIGGWRPISTLVGKLYAGLDAQGQVVIAEVGYWVHLLVVLVFLVELPQGKHFHVVTSVPAVLLRDLEPPGRLPKAPEFNGKVGVSEAEQYQWRQMLDFYTCTECGRCQDVCPAYHSGMPLSPKLLMMNLRQNLTERGDALRKPGTEAAKAVLAKPLVGGVITDQVLWSCTTCYACDQECPLFIEHVVPIVDMRRHLVFEGRMDGMLQDALGNLGRYGNSFGQSERGRAKWAQAIKPKIKDARKEPVEYLWFVGDYASYSAGLADVTRKTAEVFQRAGLDFGILYEAERNSGNDARRVGEEGLFEVLVEKNVEAFGKCQFKAIVTTDPHSYNALKHEYPPAQNGPYQVLHYAELLDRLIAEGKLKFNKQLGYKVTYHDPCYLGRYNGVYDAPRRVIQATGCQLVEMPRHGDRALCCGAGGGRIWMEEGQVKERPSESRIREAAALDGVTAFVVACPKDTTMYRDAIKTTGQDGRLAVKDLIELVHEAM